MKIITRDTDYAIRALCCIVGSASGKVTVTDLSEELDIPRPFLRKIFQKLNKKGVLRSFKGKKGGFFLAADPRKITILDLVEILQGVFRLSDHMFKGKICPEIRTCYLKKRLDKLEKNVKKDLASITISELVRQGDKGKERRAKK
jgi:Rrf2 family protein